MNKIYVVTAIDYGETVDGHASLVGKFKTREEAVEAIKYEMEDSLMSCDTATPDWENFEVWENGREYEIGCIWDIHEIAL